MMRCRIWACIMAAQSYWSSKKQYWDAATETIQNQRWKLNQAFCCSHQMIEPLLSSVSLRPESDL
jgi:hypothetical protein